MKVEFYDRYLWPTKAAAKLAVGDWIERVSGQRAVVGGHRGRLDAPPPCSISRGTRRWPHLRCKVMTTWRKDSCEGKISSQQSGLNAGLLQTSARQCQAALIGQPKARFIAAQ